jgi:hypothetical protein
LSDDGGGGRGQRRSGSRGAWRRAVSTTVEVTGGVESGIEETDGDLEFCDESEMTRKVGY